MVKYDSNKYSGIKSIGDIPSHWEVKHLRNFLRIFSEKGFGSCQLLSVTREKGVILRDRNNTEENHNFVPDDLSGYKHLYAGDFVINKMKSWQGSYGLSDYEGIVSPAYFTCKLNGVNPQFFSRALRSKAYIGFFMQFSKGIRVDQWDLDPNSMKDIPFILPPENEQKRIVDYLDEQCERIDEAIAQQQKMIDLLNERKQIIINKVVTKGLNPDVEMKDSGVNWIGLVPAHWKVNKAKFHFATKKEIIGKDYHKYERLALTLKGVIKRQYGDDIGLNPESLSTYQVVQENDLIFKLIDLENISTSRVGLSPYSGLVSPAYIRIFAKDDICHQYFEYYYLNMWHRHIFNDFGSDGVRSNLSASDLLAIKILIPPIDEQLRISQYIKGQTEVLNKYLSHLQASIDALNERKQILIGNAVTGKFKI